MCSKYLLNKIIFIQQQMCFISSEHSYVNLSIISIIAKQCSTLSDIFLVLSINKQTEAEMMNII